MYSSLNNIREEISDFKYRAVDKVLGPSNRHHTFAYKLLLPALLMMAIIHFIPIAWGILISFLGLDSSTITNWTDAPIVFLDNYIEVYHPETSLGSRYYYSARQTLIFTFGTIIGSYTLGLVTALILNREFRGNIIARTVVLVPYIAPIIVTFYAWRLMFLSESGLVNHFLHSINLISEDITWLVGENSIWALIITNVWRNFPLVAILLYAALQSIPRAQYEAAAIDGAGYWGKFRYITLPHIFSASAVIILLLTLWSLINFTAPFVLFGEAPPQAARVLMIFIYWFSFQSYEFGIGSAMSVGLFAIAMAFTVVYFKKIIGDKL